MMPYQIRNKIGFRPQYHVENVRRNETFYINFVKFINALLQQTTLIVTSFIHIQHETAHSSAKNSSSFLLFQTELSHNLQQLSERAKSTTEFIQRLKGMSDKVNVSTNTVSFCLWYFFIFLFWPTSPYILVSIPNRDFE